MRRRRMLWVAAAVAGALVAGTWLRALSAPARAQTALSLALERLAAGDPAEARRLVRIACDALPQSAEASYVAAAAEAASGDLRSAYSLAERAAELAPRDAEKALTAGLVARELAALSGNEVWPERSRTWIAAAVARASAAVEDRPDATAPRLYAAATRLAAGEPEEALRHLEGVTTRSAGEKEQVGVLLAAALRMRERPATGAIRRDGPSGGASASRDRRDGGAGRSASDVRPGRRSASTVALDSTAATLLDSKRTAAATYVVYVDDRAAFEASLRGESSSTVVDSGGAFAADPTAATGQSSVTRSGSVGGQSFEYTAYDVDASNSPTGTVTPGSAGGDVADTDGVNVERPAAQGTAVGSGSWGLDGATGSTATRNALLVDFTTTPGGLGIGHFGLDLIDFEASAAFTQGEIRLYDGGVLVFSSLFDWGPSDGNNSVHFLGIVALAPDPLYFDQAMVILGDDSAGGGFSEQWAADRLTFGRAVATPEPATWALFALGAAGAAVFVHRRRRRDATSLRPAEPGEVT